jgi:hypothetical protein
MSTNPGPGPAYDLQAGEGNRIVDASHYITTFVIALIVQQYIRNGLELFADGVSLAVLVLLGMGLVTLLTFAFESYLTATGRSDSLSREELPYEIGRALFSLLALLGLHNFSLVLSRRPADGVTAGAIASQFAWGLAVVYVGYLGIRVVIAEQNRLLGREPDDRDHEATAMYSVYILVWIQFAELAPRLTDWEVTVAFVLVITASLYAYFGLWRDRYEKLIGVPPEEGLIDIDMNPDEFSDVDSIRYEQRTDDGRRVEIHAHRPEERERPHGDGRTDCWLVDVRIDGTSVDGSPFTDETVRDVQTSVNRLLNESTGA